MATISFIDPQHTRRHKLGAQLTRVAAQHGKKSGTGALKGSSASCSEEGATKTVTQRGLLARAEGTCWLSETRLKKAWRAMELDSKALKGGARLELEDMDPAAGAARINDDGVLQCGSLYCTPLCRPLLQ